MKDSVATEVPDDPAERDFAPPPIRVQLVDAATLDPAELRDSGVAHGLYAGPGKRALDIVGALAILIVFAPFLIVIAVTLKLRYGGSVLFGHRRIGLNNNEFPCLKFRTMFPDADRLLAEHLRADPALMEEWTSTQKLRNDPRVHGIGRILRKSSLDELPQLFNVLAGHMSLVGPRPIVRDEIRYYGLDFRYYLSTRPGITGLWQVSGRSDTSYDQRVALDVRYARERSLPVDIRILLRTVVVVLTGRGAC